MRIVRDSPERAGIEHRRRYKSRMARSERFLVKPLLLASRERRMLGTGPDGTPARTVAQLDTEAEIIAASAGAILNVEAEPGTIPADYGWTDAATLAAYLHRDRHSQNPDRASLPTARAVTLAIRRSHGDTTATATIRQHTAFPTTGGEISTTGHRSRPAP